MTIHDKLRRHLRDAAWAGRGLGYAFALGRGRTEDGLDVFRLYTLTEAMLFTTKAAVELFHQPGHLLGRIPCVLQPKPHPDDVRLIGSAYLTMVSTGTSDTAAHLTVLRGELRPAMFGAGHELIILCARAPDGWPP